MELSQDYQINCKKLVENTKLNFTLFPHQCSLLQWMRLIEFNLYIPSVFKGGVIADDMGLGKTKSVCSLIGLNVVNKTLILTPLSTRDNFILECLKLLYYDDKYLINVYKLEKNKFYLCELDKSNNISFKTNPLKGKGTPMQPFVLISNHDCANEFITTRTWDRIIIDEGHFLRNNNTIIHKRLFDLNLNRSNDGNIICPKWIITGTPIQMQLTDLDYIFRFIDSRFLPVDQVNSHYYSNQRLQLIYNYLFRRRKENITKTMKSIMNFPDKNVFYHEELINLVDTELSNYLINLNNVQLNQFYSNEQNYKLILKDEKAFMICVVRNLIEEKSKEESYFGLSEVSRQIISFPYSYALSNTFNLNYTGTMSKINRFYNIFETGGRKSFVIFYYFKSIAEFLYNNLKNRYSDVYVFNINGETDVKERTETINKCNLLINEGKTCILLSSILATCEGLNYQFFSNMAFFDHFYNPKVIEQAEARINRIGQFNEVHIYKLYINGFRYGINENDFFDYEIKLRDYSDGKSNLSELINGYNAAWSFKRYYIKVNGEYESGVYFGDDFELRGITPHQPPNSVGPNYIL